MLCNLSSPVIGIDTTWLCLYNDGMESQTETKRKQIILPVAMDKALSDYATRNGMKQGFIVRQALANWLKERTGQKFDPALQHGGKRA